MLFSQTLTYDTLSIKFDFFSIWLSMDEYIEHFFQEKCSHVSFICILQHSKPRKTRAKLVLQYNIHQRQHMATSSSQALDIWSDIFYTCWYWSVKQTRTDMPPSQSCMSLPPPPHPTSSPALPDLSITSRREGVQGLLTAQAQQFLLLLLFSGPAGDSKVM